jgi:hypothetical protein
VWSVTKEQAEIIVQYPSNWHVLTGIRLLTRAAFFTIRRQHEMIDDKLFAAIEQVKQSDWAIGSLEGIRLSDLNHGELTALCCERVAGTSGSFLFEKKLLASCEPFCRGNDLHIISL